MNNKERNEMKAMLFAAMAAVTMGAGAYAPAKSPLMTEWGAKTGSLGRRTGRMHLRQRECELRVDQFENKPIP